MSVVKLATKTTTDKSADTYSKSNDRVSSAAVYSLKAKRRAVSFEIAKKNMKLAAQNLDW